MRAAGTAGAAEEDMEGADTKGALGGKEIEVMRGWA